MIGEVENISDAVVYAGEESHDQPNGIWARVSLERARRVRTSGGAPERILRGRLEPFKVPVHVLVVEGMQHGTRFRKMRNT